MTDKNYNIFYALITIIGGFLLLVLPFPQFTKYDKPMRMSAAILLIVFGICSLVTYHNNYNKNKKL